MKKTLALILTVMLLCCACAENGTYVSDSGLFSYQYPEGYIALSSASIDEVLSDPDMKAVFDNAGVDVSALKSTDGTLMEFLYTPDFSGNMNVITMPNTGINMDYMIVLQDMFYSAYVEQYVALGAKEEDVAFLGFLEYGANTYFGIKVQLWGVDMTQYVICDDNGTMCTFTFSMMDEEAISTVLSSFTYAAAEAAA